MSEHNMGEDHLKPIETYLQSIEVNDNTVRDRGVQRELAGGTQDDVISAETVRGIMGNLNAQMSELSKKLKAADPKLSTGFEMNEHVSINKLDTSDGNYQYPNNYNRISNM
ncbi:UNVERIFIED_CONTAM: hypothetical protein RMT77_001378 [Armadillidium vulgare]